MCLQGRESRPYHFASWSFNKKWLVLNQKVDPNYRDKVDYNSSDHSLCIKKLTETDSGIYKFEIVGHDFNQSTETHELIVQEAVPRPVIRMSGLHPNFTAGLCNISVNCSIKDDWVWSVCDEDSCRTSLRSLLRKVNIVVFIDNRSVVCRGYNQASENNVSESTEGMCLRQSNPVNEETSEPPAVIVIVIVVCVLLCAFVACVVWGLCSTEYNHHQDQTPTAQSTQSQPVEAQPQSVQRVSTSSSGQAEACYENVDAMQPCQASSPTISPREQLGPKQSLKVDTVYSTVQVPHVASSLGMSDSSEADKIREATTSQYAVLNEAEHRAQIDTVYSVLQRPKI